MLRQLLTASLALLASGVVTAQSYVSFPTNAYSLMSPDGTLFVEEAEGNVNIYDRKADKTYPYPATVDINGNEITYHCGPNHCITSDGMVVGSVGFIASVWKNGEWTALPQSRGKKSGMNGALAVTSDGSRIVGLLGYDDRSMTSDDDITFATPVVWTRQADGSYVETQLPYPELDFTRLAPQYVTGVDISDNGKTIVGSVRDSWGMAGTMIVWQEDAQGKWTYSEPSTDLVYDAEKAKLIPTLPKAPKFVNGEDYLNADEAKAFQDALTEYNELYNQYVQGDISFEEVPVFPLPQYYMNAEALAQYKADSTAYVKAQAEFDDAYYDFVDKRAACLTGDAFDFNSVVVSANGKWIVATLKSGTPVIIDAATGERRIIEGGDYLGSAVTNDGTAFVCSPLNMGYSRSAFVVMPGATDVIPASEYITKLGFKDYAEKGFSGTVKCSPDGRILLGFHAPAVGGGDGSSILLDLRTETGIGEATTTDGTARTAYFGLDGRRLTAPAKGVYLEQTTVGGVTKTVKRVK